MRGEITAELLEAMGFERHKDDEHIWRMSYGPTRLLGWITVMMLSKNIVVEVMGSKQKSYGVFGFNTKTLLGAVHDAGAVKARYEVGQRIADAFRDMYLSLPPCTEEN